MAKKKEKTLEEKLQEALVPENQWPYMLPENWCWTRLDFIANYKKGPFGSSLTKAMFVPKGKNTYKVYEQGNAINKSTQYGSYYITKEKYDSMDGFSVEPNDIIVSCAGTIGEIFRLPQNIEKGIINQALMRVRLNSSVVYQIFEYYFSNILIQNITDESNGTAIKNIPPFKVLKQMPFPLPPLPEQKRIVHRIESLFAKLDEAKEKIQQVLDGAEMRKAAILHKAFTGELTKNWRKENGISEDSWEVKKLSECGNWYGGGTPSKTHPEYWEKGNILWITSKDMKSDYIEDSQQHINSYGVENSSAKYIEEHALICVMRSGILRHSFPVAVIKKTFTVNQDLKVLVPNKMINIEYLLFICKYKEQSILNSCMKNGTTVESINFDKLKNFSIMIPAEIEQIRIVNIIKKFLCRENDVLNKCNKFITSIYTMKKSILAKAFRGELGTNNPTEDSAINLLKEVLQDKF